MRAVRPLSDRKPKGAAERRHRCNKDKGPSWSSFKPRPDGPPPASHDSRLEARLQLAPAPRERCARWKAKVRRRQSAIVAVLEQADGELRVREIHAGVEARMGEPVSRFSEVVHGRRLPAQSAAFRMLITTLRLLSELIRHGGSGLTPCAPGRRLRTCVLGCPRFWSGLPYRR